MKLFHTFSIAVLFLFMIGSGQAVFGQISFSLSDSPDNIILVSGKSTLEKWRLETRAFTGEALINLKPGNDITGITELNFSIIVDTLKGSNKGISRTARKTLKAKHFPTIDYRLTSAKVVAESDYIFQIHTIGQLTLAGVSRDVSVEMYCKANKNGSITCTAMYDLLMTDYNIRPPYFLAGLLSADDRILIDLSMRFER